MGKDKKRGTYASVGQIELEDVERRVDQDIEVEPREEG
jgi:hypothetical protein